ncbi:uncharacterized protein PG998_014488 [Apiospora kogelbergensis]|uniref:uncharacterized protein n=1 Tax=Apiospora kogelbergensis TaxID=1337665 RepID=UPI00312E4DBC
MEQASSRISTLESSSLEGPQPVWQPCYYPTNEVSSLKETFGSRHGVHFIGFTANFRFCKLAVTTEAADVFREGSVQIQWEDQDAAVAKPLVTFASIQGELGVKTKALHSFRTNAIWGIEKYGRQLAPIYRSDPGFSQVQLQLESSILVSDIKRSSSGIQELFAQLLIQACLYLEEATDFVRVITAERIVGQCQVLFIDKPDTLDKEGQKARLYQVALLRRLFQMAGGQEDELLSQTYPPPAGNPYKSLQLLGIVVGVPEGSFSQSQWLEQYASTAVPLRSFQERAPNRRGFRTKGSTAT